MNKEGKINGLFSSLQKIGKAIKKTYLYKLISKFLSTACSIILVLLLIVGALIFYFNMKAKAYGNKGIDYTVPFGLYTIISGSMEPNVSVYDVVIAVDQDISKIKVGDVITFVSSWDINYGLTVTHRVIAISKNESGEYQITTKGDNNSTADGGVVTQNNLIGKVVGRIPQLGRLQFFLATKMGWFLVVFIPALFIIVLDMVKIFKLYVLKNQIDNVKPHKEARREQIEKELEAKNAPLVELNSEALAVREHVDDTIDTVELPKVDVDGKIKETTSELPKMNLEEIYDDLPSIDTSYEKSPTIKIPVLKKDSPNKENIEIDNLEIQRSMLKKRNK